MDFEGITTVHTVLNIDRHYMIYSAFCEVEKGKQFVPRFGKFCSAYGVNICSVNLDCETTFLTLHYTRSRFFFIVLSLSTRRHPGMPQCPEIDFKRV